MVALSLNMFMSCQSEYEGESANITTKIAKRQKHRKRFHFGVPLVGQRAFEKKV